MVVSPSAGYFSLVPTRFTYTPLPILRSPERAPQPSLRVAANHAAHSEEGAVTTLPIEHTAEWRTERSRPEETGTPDESDGGPRPLLVCGILASLLYAAMLAFVPLQWPGYRSAARVPSELAAIGAPTRSLWVTLGVVYGALYVAAGAGVWRSAGGRRTLRAAGALMITQAIVGTFWPPMHLRGAQPTLTDTLHVVFAGIWLVLMLLIMASGAASLGRRFRWYTIATVVVFVVFGTMTSLEAPRVAANLPTPLIGVWERTNIGASLLWVIAFMIALLHARAGVTPAPRSGAMRPESSAIS